MKLNNTQIMSICSLIASIISFSAYFVVPITNECVLSVKGNLECTTYDFGTNFIVLGISSLILSIVYFVYSKRSEHEN